jgi:hypothetical protein
MSSHRSPAVVHDAVPVDVPDERTYQTDPDADLDRALVDAIEAAQRADNEYLAGVLANELGSHYYSTR